MTSTRALTNIALSLVMGLNLINPALAGDPFRAKENRLGDKTTAAFEAVFQEGDYPKAQSHLQDAISTEAEPLAYAMAASLAYTTHDWSTVNAYAQKTLVAAENLTSTDKLRGNLYTAVGHFISGVVILRREGKLTGVPRALNKLRQVYQYLDRAAAIDSRDPELNLIQGYMDLVLAVNLPFTNTDDAIIRLKNHAAPSYLAYRGIAIAYRDLKMYAQALEYVNTSLKAAPENPELYYLKAQILRQQGQQFSNLSMLEEAVNNFEVALRKKSQLPSAVVRQMQREHQQAREHVNKLRQIQ